MRIALACVLVLLVATMAAAQFGRYRYRRLAVSSEAQPSRFAIAEAATCSVAAARPKRSVARNALIPPRLDKENPGFPLSLPGRPVD